MLRVLVRAAIVLAVIYPVRVRSQQQISRQQAIDAAVARGARTAVARADTLVGAALLLSARSRDNPSLSASYSKSTPHYHAIVDLPFDISGLRSARVRSAQAGRLASQYRFQFERAAAALDADTTYTRALAALEHLRLSRRNARDADSLRRMAAVRRSAGDASELDVLLATLNAGQAENMAAADSVAFVSTLFDLQVVMGLDSTRGEIVPSDSLSVPPPLGTTAESVALPVAAATQSLAAAELAVAAQQRSLFAPFAIQAGVEYGDPGERGVLPTFGLSVPLPLFNTNRGGIALAVAERERARAELDLAEYETRAVIGRARRQLTVALEKIERDRRLVESANRIAAMSLVAYREGAQALPTVLEAQRNARDILSQYVSDLADAWIASATLRLYGLGPHPA